MGYCSNCGTNLSEGVKFCPECGYALSVHGSTDGFGTLEAFTEEGSFESGIVNGVDRDRRKAEGKIPAGRCTDGKKKKDVTVRCEKCGCTQLDSHKRGWSWYDALKLFACDVFISIILVFLGMWLYDYLAPLAAIGMLGIYLSWLFFVYGGIARRHDIVVTCLNCGHAWRK